MKVCSIYERIDILINYETSIYRTKHVFCLQLFMGKQLGYMHIYIYMCTYIYIYIFRYNSRHYTVTNRRTLKLIGLIYYHFVNRFMLRQKYRQLASLMP